MVNIILLSIINSLSNPPLYALFFIMTTHTDSTVADARERFIELIGLQTQNEGLTRNAGRIFGLLLFDGNAVAFGELAEQLQISRGGVSTSVRILEERGLIKRSNKLGDRQDYFQLADDPYTSILARTHQRKVDARKELETIAQQLPESALDISRRLSDFVDFHRVIERGLLDALDAMNTSATPDQHNLIETTS